MQRVVTHEDSMQCIFHTFDVADIHDIATLNTLKSVSKSWCRGVRSVLLDWKRAAGSWAMWDVIYTHHTTHGLCLPIACTLHPERLYGILTNGPTALGCTTPGHPACSMRGVLKDMAIEIQHDIFNSRDDEIDDKMMLTRFVFECEGVTYHSIASAMSHGFTCRPPQTARQEIESITLGTEVDGYWFDFAWREELLEHEVISGDTVLYRTHDTSVVTVVD